MRIFVAGFQHETNTFAPTLADWQSLPAGTEVLSFAEPAPDAATLIGWLRERPLLHVDRDLGWMMLHAGLAPKWGVSHAERHAREVERRL